MNGQQADIQNRTREEWLALGERYFEALTTADEERELRRFLATAEAQGREFDELRAVMGFLTVGKREQERRRHRTLRLNISRVAAVVGVLLVVAGSAFYAVDRRQNQCVAYIGGVKYTDESVVLAEMHRSMDDMGEASEAMDIDSQMADIFSTLGE